MLRHFALVLVYTHVISLEELRVFTSSNAFQLSLVAVSLDVSDVLVVRITFRQLSALLIR